MTNITKARGKNNTINKIIEMIDEIQDDIASHKIIVAHSDAYDIALLVKNKLIEKYGEGLDIEFVVVNPTAGSHCGPNCVGVAFHAKHR